MTAPRGPVVVGIDGTVGSEGALRYAIDEARRARAPLTIVHVVPDYVAMAPMLPLPPDDLKEAGSSILREAEDDARRLAPDVQVDGWLYRGGRAIELARAAERARLLVVGRDDKPLLERLLRGDTAVGAAARAAVPVVEVPRTWRPTEEPDSVVLVGVKPDTHTSMLLGDAMAIASQRGARLSVLHAWKLPTAYDDIIEARVAVENWVRESTATVESLLSAWRAAYPEVKVEISVVHDHAAHALVQASLHADLVVVARRAHGFPAPMHLGATARAVLHSAHCPVRVVPANEAVELPGLLLEQGGAVVK